MTAFTATEAPSAGFPPWTVRQARWFLIAMHLPFLATAPTLTVTGFQDRPPGNIAVAVLAAVMLGCLQVRHSLAAARGERPRWWRWTLLAVIAGAYLPMWAFTFNWISAQWFVVASAVMLLRGRWAAVVAAAPVIGTAVVTALVAGVRENGTLGQVTILVLYNVMVLTTGAGALYASARLVREVADLYRARTEMAELAVGRERLRVSRDLHDLLGQSLSAVSLKGDLAMRLLATDRSAARDEIDSLTAVARAALHDVRAVTRDTHRVGLTTEIEAAAALLGAAGIDAHVDVDLSGLSPAAEEALAWAVREGTTNMLRHSEARRCRLTARTGGLAVRLEMVNDGARPPLGAGSGLTGVTERARALGGSATAGPTDDGGFRLVVEVPREAA